MANTVDRLSYLNSVEYEYTSTDHTFNPVKSLTDLFEEVEECDTENLRVYLRVRPSLPEENIESEEFKVDLLNENSVVLTAPASSNTFKNASHGISKLSQKFTFSRIYGPATTQKELFDVSTHGLVNDFVMGQNILLFTYGATNSGKTFTVQGTPSDPGILPRSLDSIFRSIGEKHYPRNDLKPKYFCNISRLEEKDVKKEEEKKQNIFRMSFEQGARFSLSISNLSKISSEMSLNETQPSSANTSAVSSVIEVPSQEDASIIEVCDTGNTVYAVFVSFAEIYNEYIYDLLEQMPQSMKKRRNPLMLGEDRNASIYVKGLHEVRVNSAEEALKLLEVGRQNLHFAATRLNHNSSRSHCIFTIKIVRLADANNPHVARVSMMSICDLAGSERAGKTKSNQDRLKEAGNINSSLLVLSRCLDALRQNQMQKFSKKKEVPVPYRDSKLTRLFQSFFLGRGKAAMIVNISKSPLLFDETLQVLKFSAIAKQVAISHSKEPVCQVAAPKRSSQLSKFVRQSLNTSGRLSVPWMKDLGDVTFGASEKKGDSMCIAEEPENDEEEEEDEKYSALLDLVTRLRDKLFQEHKEKVELEDRLREELCNEFSQHMVEVENSWSEKLKDQRSRMEEFHENRIDALMKCIDKSDKGRKRLRPDNYDPDEEYVPSISLFQEQVKTKEQKAKIEDLEMEQQHLKEELEVLKCSQKKTFEQANRLQEENSKLTFQLAQLTRCLKRTEKELEDTKKTLSSSTDEDQKVIDLRCLLDESQSSSSAKDNELKELKEMLFEAADEFLIKEEEIKSLSALLEKEKQKSTKQLMTVNELESQLAEAREILSHHAVQLEERDQHISDLQEQQNPVQNVEDGVNEMKELHKTAESYHMQMVILEQSLSATERERNKAEKELQELREKCKHREEDYLRDKSKLLLELAELKRMGNKNGQSGMESKAILEEALSNATRFEEESKSLKLEKNLLQNQLTESKDLFEHMQRTNLELESYQKMLQNEKLDLQKNVEELSMKLMTLQDERAAEQLDTSASNVSITNQVNTLKNKIQDNSEVIVSLNKQLTVQEECCKKATEEKEKLDMLNKELALKIEELEASQLDLDSHLEDLELLKKDLEAEKETNVLLEQEKEEILRCKEENESALLKLQDELKHKDDIVATFKSDIDSLEADLQKMTESEQNLLKQLKEGRVELDKNVADLSKQKSLEEEISLLKERVADKKTQVTCELEKLEVDLDSERKLREEYEIEKCELNKLVTLKNSELETCRCEKEQIKRELEIALDTYARFKEENVVNLEKLTDEKNSLVSELDEIKKAVDVLKEEKEGLESQQEHTRKEMEQLKETEACLRGKVLDVKAAESQLKEDKLSSQQELLSCKEDLLLMREAMGSINEEKTSLKSKYENLCKLQEDLNIKLKEKEEVITKLNAKVESLDRKMNYAEEDFEKKEKRLNDKLSKPCSKCDILEKEARALREAREQEVNQAHDQEDVIRKKDCEVSTLQQEVKRLLQMSMTSSMCNVSQSSETPNPKKEVDEQERSIMALQEEVRLHMTEKESLAKKVMTLERQLDSLSLTVSPDMSTSKHVNDPSLEARMGYFFTKETPRSQRKHPRPTAADGRKAENMMNPMPTLSDASDEESIAKGTPVPKPRSCRKTKTPAKTPLKTRVQLDTTEEDFLPVIKLTAPKSTRSRGSRHIVANKDKSFVYDDSDDNVWEPPVIEKKVSRGGGRKPRGRKTKTSQVFNPHLNNQENNSLVANTSPEIAPEDKKTPADIKTPATQKKKRTLFKSVDDELYVGSPNVVEVSHVEDSPHSVVRRQLRSKRK